MSHVDISFYVWLAAQPAFVEVAVGVAFVLVLAPAVLAVVAQLITRLEDWVVVRATLYLLGGNPDAARLIGRFVRLSASSSVK